MVMCLYDHLNCHLREQNLSELHPYMNVVNLQCIQQQNNTIVCSICTHQMPLTTSVLEHSTK
jgi:hypothetical protein